MESIRNRSQRPLAALTHRGANGVSGLDGSSVRDRFELGKDIVRIIECIALLIGIEASKRSEPDHRSERQPGRGACGRSQESSPINRRNPTCATGQNARRSPHPRGSKVDPFPSVSLISSDLEEPMSEVESAGIRHGRSQRRRSRDLDIEFDLRAKSEMIGKRTIDVSNASGLSE